MNCDPLAELTMGNSDDLQVQPRWTLNSLRWLSIVPAAVLGGWLGRTFGIVFLFLRAPVYPDFLFPLLSLLPSGLAFTLVGTLLAPRHRNVVAICLAACCVILSLFVHICSQAHPGLVNYMHSTGQSLGAMLGLALTVIRLSKQSGSDGSAEATFQTKTGPTSHDS